MKNIWSGVGMPAIKEVTKPQTSEAKKARRKAAKARRKAKEKARREAVANYFGRIKSAHKPAPVYEVKLEKAPAKSKIHGLPDHLLTPFTNWMKVKGYSMVDAEDYVEEYLAR